MLLLQHIGPWCKRQGRYIESWSPLYHILQQVMHAHMYLYTSNQGETVLKNLSQLSPSKSIIHHVNYTGQHALIQH